MKLKMFAICQILHTEELVIGHSVISFHRLLTYRQHMETPIEVLEKACHS